MCFFVEIMNFFTAWAAFRRDEFPRAAVHGTAPWNPESSLVGIPRRSAGNGSRRKVVSVCISRHRRRTAAFCRFQTSRLCSGRRQRRGAVLGLNGCLQTSRIAQLTARRCRRSPRRPSQSGLAMRCLWRETHTVLATLRLLSGATTYRRPPRSWHGAVKFRPLSNETSLWISRRPAKSRRVWKRPLMSSFDKKGFFKNSLARIVYVWVY